MSIKKDIVWRVGIVYLMVLLFGLLILGKVVYIQLFEAEKWRNKSNSLSLKDKKIYPNRGDIYASDGRLLATSVPYYEIRMDLKSNALEEDLFYENIDSLSYCLSKLFGDRSARSYKYELIRERNKGNRYHLIKRRVTYTQLKEIKTFPVFRLGRYKGGLIVNQTNKRILPHNNLAARTIGYNSEGVAVGIEGAFDHYLKGRVGMRLEQKLSGGVWMPLDDRNAVEPMDGKDILTTIDVNLQDVAERALMRQLMNVHALHGTVVLMEVKTGDIKAIVNLKENDNGKYTEAYNFAVGESTEPGSTFKLASLIVALEDKHIDLNDTVNTGKGEIQYYDKKYTDTKKGGYGKITVQEVFEYSSNVGVTKIITKCYKNKEQQFVDRLYSMNLNERLGIEIRGEGKPYIKYPTDPSWSGVTLPSMSIGYELQMTPLQTLTLYNAIANNGKMVKPKFVKAILNHGRVVRIFKTEVINPSICSRQTVAKVKKLLEGVVENGTGSNLKNNNYSIAGKTGTARIANNKYGYYHGKAYSYQASFAGYFPADDPKYSCIVVVNSPKSGFYYGRMVAAPVFKEIADKVYATTIDLIEKKEPKNEKLADNIPYSKNSYKEELEYVMEELDIPYNNKNVISDWVVTTKKDKTIEMQNRFIKNNVVPVVGGMGAKDAIYILENAGLKVIMKGRGIVQKQSIEPGTRIQKGQKIIIELG